MAEGHRKRMKQRFFDEGIDNFKPHEVLEVLLYFAYPRRDTNKIAHDLINEFGSFHGVLDASHESLVAFGLTDHVAATIKLIPAFSNYYLQSRVNNIKTFNDCTSIGNYVVNKVGERTNEVFGVLCLNMHRQFINFEIIEEGTVNSTTVSPRKVAECALKNNASKVVFVHNHPGGSLMPSPDDKVLTQTLLSMLNSIEVGLIDHIIVANGRFCSMSEQNML